jgi:hypothetical protein
MTNDITVKTTKGGGLLIGKSDSQTTGDTQNATVSTSTDTSYRSPISDEDRKLASEREPIAILLTYGMAGDVVEKWFHIDDPDTEEADPALDRLVQNELSKLKYRTKLKQLLTQKLIYKWSLLVGAFTDTKVQADLKKPLAVGSDLKQLQVYNRTNVRIVEKDLNPMSLRYGKPVIYELNRGNGILTEIHYTRCCKFPDEECDEQSVLDGIWNDMNWGANIRYGAAMYMDRVGIGFPVFEFPEGTTLTELTSFDSQIPSIMSKSRICIAQNSPTANTGMKFHFEGAAGSVIDPTPFFKTNDEQISKATGIPQPSLVGAQAGAVTGSEVNMQGKYKVVSRYQAELEDVNRWTIDRLAESGQIGLVASGTATDKLKAVLARVFGKDYRHKTAQTYNVTWNSAFELSEKDEAQIEFTHAQTREKQLGWMSKDEVRAEEGLDPLPDGAGEWKDQSEFGGEQFLVQSKQRLKSKENTKEEKDNLGLSIDAETPEGTWVTIRGTHILIKEGESVSTAFQRTTGKKLTDFENKLYEKKFTAEKENKIFEKNYKENTVSGNREELNTFYETVGEGGEEGYDPNGNILSPSKTETTGFQRNSTPNAAQFSENKQTFKMQYNTLSEQNKSIIRTELGWKEGQHFDMVMKGRENATEDEFKKWFGIVKTKTFVWQP